MLQATVRTLATGFMAAALAACGSSTTAPNTPPGTVTASSSLVFTPSTVTVTRSGAAATVTWVFQNVAHTVLWDSQPTGATVAGIPSTSGASVARDFTIAGTYTYHCTIHSNMTGTVIVQ